MCVCVYALMYVIRGLVHVCGRAHMERSEYKLSRVSSGAVHVFLRQGLLLALDLLSTPVLTDQ